MRKGIVAIVLVSFVTVSLFGLFAMATMHGNCIAETVNGGLCPLANPLAGIVFHLDAFKVFSNAVFSSSIALLLVLLVLAFHFLYLRNEHSYQGARFASVRFTETKHIPLRKRFLSWISLHEKRDPSAFIRVSCTHLG